MIRHPHGERAAGSALRSALRASLHTQPANPHRGVNSQPALQDQFSIGLDSHPHNPKGTRVTHLASQLTGQHTATSQQAHLNP